MPEFVTQEFVAISVSTYDSASLATRLTERSAEGWSVVSIVQTGTTVTAFLSRPTGASTAATATQLATTAAATTTIAASAPAVDTPATSTPADVTPADSTTAASTTAASTSGSDSAQPSAAAAPAGWYADPAKRFELRYWDGSTWTEYVSRAGQQYTDPPVA